jgi:uncharacterized protein with ATP-grasp and redox domains
MKTYLDCFPCLLRQALEAARMAEADAGQSSEPCPEPRRRAAEGQQRAILNRVMELLVGVSADSTPAETSCHVHRIVREMTGVRDPYRLVKEEATRHALQLVPRLREIVVQAADRLEQAVRIAIAGNIIDFAPGVQFTLEATLERVLHQPFAINDLEALRRALSKAQRVLYLADNAGETVFDRVLIEILEQPVIYAVKGGPTLNDATQEDAIAAGLEEVAEIVSTGSDAPGTVLEYCTPAFRQLYDEAELIIAKGQANHEALDEGDRRLFFLLQVKCPVLGREIGVEPGSIVLEQG